MSKYTTWKEPTIIQEIKDLVAIWELKDRDIHFYFEKIFEPSLELLRRKASSDRVTGRVFSHPERQSQYKALLLPVGFTILPLVTMTALFDPQRVHLVFSPEAFSKKRADLINYIKRYCPNVELTDKKIPGKASAILEEVQRWHDDTLNTYGYKKSQLAIDLTGGKKTMILGARKAAEYLGISTFYLDVEYDENGEYAIPGTEFLISDEVVTDQDLIFVIMPFSSEFDETYQKGIKAPISELGLNCMRVDEDIYLEGIMSRIRKLIANANMIVAEISYGNPNVMYELGIAHATNKKVIILSRSIDSVPSDLRHLPIVIYGSDIKLLRSKLVKYIKNLR